MSGARTLKNWISRNQAPEPMKRDDVACACTDQSFVSAECAGEAVAALLVPALSAELPPRTK